MGMPVNNCNKRGIISVAVTVSLMHRGILLNIQLSYIQGFAKDD